MIGMPRHCLSAVDFDQTRDFQCVSSFQESERTEGAAPGVTPPFPRRGERPEPRSAQGRVEGEGAEAPGRHQEPARQTAPTGEEEGDSGGQSNGNRKLVFIPDVNHTHCGMVV